MSVLMSAPLAAGVSPELPAWLRHCQLRARFRRWRSGSQQAREKPRGSADMEQRQIHDDARQEKSMPKVSSAGVLRMFRDGRTLFSVCNPRVGGATTRHIPLALVLSLPERTYGRRCGWRADGPGRSRSCAACDRLSRASGDDRLRLSAAPGDVVFKTEGYPQQPFSCLLGDHEECSITKSLVHHHENRRARPRTPAPTRSSAIAASSIHRSAPQHPKA